MPAALSGVIQGAYFSTGTGTVAWPTGAAAGHLAVLCMATGPKGTPEPKPLTDGWRLRQPGATTAVYSKRLTAADLASALPVQGTVEMLQTFVGAGDIGNITTTSGVKLTVAGAGLLMFCRGEDSGTNLTPTSGKLHSPDVVNASNKNRRHNVWFVPYSTTGYKSLSSNGDFLSCFEILPLAPPNAPTLSTPAVDQQVDPADPVAFAWLHNSSQGVPQDEFKLRVREVSTATWYYVTSSGALTTIETSVATSATAFSVAAAALAVSKTYEWTVATKDSNAWGPYATARQFTTAAKPTISSITVTSPLNDLSPTIAWAATMGLGSQVAYRVVLRANAAPNRIVWDSGTQSGGATSVTAPNATEWVNGEALRAYVQVRQSGGLWSTETADDVTSSVTWTPPSTPTAVTATTPDDSPLVVTVSGINTGYSGPVEIQGSDDGQVSWFTVASLPPSAATMNVPVPSAVYGVNVRYRARQSNTIDGVPMGSAWRVASADVASADKRAYFVSDDGAEWLHVRIRDDSDRERAEGISVTYGLSVDDDTEARPRVHRTPPAGWSGRTTVALDTEADRSTLLDFLHRNPVFVIRWNPEQENGEYVEVGRMRVQRTTQLGAARLVQAPLGLRNYTLGWVEA